ncbi:MAG TPA: NAD(P)/FAD-dependent oxidoreductase [Thermoanaerobaculia bacterium]|nr:NAD(P)/FAD-dependent oxidoreductase [Thermoanaerobaculia bacterium]
MSDPTPATSIEPPAAPAPGSEYDVIVVGARVAGAATAMLLARRGRRVLLVDRRRPGTDTLSTHALMRAGVLQLQRWGLLDRVIAAGTPPVRSTVMHYGEVAEIVEIKPKAGVEALYAPRRTVLDTILVDAAAEAGVDVRFGVSADALLRDAAGRVTGLAGRHAAGTRFEAGARFVVGADGMRSMVAREAGAAVTHEGAASTAVVYGYYSGADLAEGYEFFYRPGVSAGLIPTNDGQFCVWAGTSSARFMAELRSEPDMGFARVLEEAAPEVAGRLGSARLEGRLHGFPGVPAYLRQPYGPGWALVGDASHFKDPISAHGITDALRDAEFLAQALTEAIEGGPAAESAALERYRETRDRLSNRLHDATEAVARYDWTMDTVRGLLIEMSRAMNAEVEVLASLDRATAPEPAPIATIAAPDHPAVAFLDALHRRDFDALERLLAPDVWMRALLPKKVREEHDAAGAAAAYRLWYGGAGECRMLDAEHHTMAGREYVRYRFVVRPDFAPEQWHLVEQAGFCRVKDGRISRLDLVCTGFHPTETAGAAEETARAA